MRGTILLLMALGLIAAGCFGQPEPVENQTNLTNVSDNETNDTTLCTGPVCGADGYTYATDCEAMEAEVTIAYTGECEVISCVDTDDGVDPEKTGTASKGDESHTDYCIDSEQLVEYACLDDDIELATLSCGEGKECKEGRCVETGEPEEPEIEPGCIGPQQPDMLTKGTVVMNGTTYVDTCIDYTTVKDYYCEDNELHSINNQCPPGYGCNQGQCEEQTYACTETDGGKDLFNRGKTIVTRGIITTFSDLDECVDFTMLKEHYCLENGTSKTEDLECGSGYKCVTGVCVESACTETDGGFDIYTVGVTTDREDEEEDKCLDDYHVREYFCEGDDMEYQDKHCGPGYICNNGKCTEGSISS